MGLLPDTHNCGLRMSRECLKRFSRHRLRRQPLDSDPDMHHGTCVTRWRGKRSRHSRRMHNPQFYVFVKKPIDSHHKPGNLCICIHVVYAFSDEMDINILLPDFSNPFFHIWTCLNTIGVLWIQWYSGVRKVVWHFLMWWYIFSVVDFRRHDLTPFFRAFHIASVKVMGSRIM